MAETKTKAMKIEDEREIQARRDAQAMELVPHYEHRPESISDKETHLIVTVNGKNYAIAYDTEIMIPRFLKKVIMNTHAQEKTAAAKARGLLATEAGGVNLGTYGG